jgi:hypothetical protein
MPCDTRAIPVNGYVGHARESCSQSLGSGLISERNRGLKQEDGDGYRDLVVNAAIDVVQQRPDDCPGFVHPPKLSQAQSTLGGQRGEPRRWPAGSSQACRPARFVEGSEPDLCAPEVQRWGNQH